LLGALFTLPPELKKDHPPANKAPARHPQSKTVEAYPACDFSSPSVLECTVAVRIDPRVDITSEDLQLQTDASMSCYESSQGQKIHPAFRW